MSNHRFVVERRALHRLVRVFTSDAMHVVAYAILCAAYIQGAISKLSDIPRATRELEAFHVHPVGLVLILVILTEALGSLMIVTGWLRWLGALWLAGFTFLANLLANEFWAMSVSTRVANENAFFEHWGLIGGLLLVAWIDLHDRAGRIDRTPLPVVA